jgi:hypothetical protein
MFSRLLVLIFLVSCATKPTPYQPVKKQEGYIDSTFEDLKVATFKGNSVIKRNKAQAYAEFRAIETCSAENKHANIIDLFDKTIEKNVIRSSGGAWGPSTYFGMYPYYGRYSTFGISGGYNTISTNSWNETLIYPVLELYYTCSDVVVRPEVYFKELSSEQMKLLVKDVRGGVQVEKIAENSPNKRALELGDIILKANGKRVEKTFEIIRLFTSPSSEVTIQLLREGERIVTKIKGIDVTAKVKESEQQIIQSVCKDKVKENQEHLKLNPLCHKK